MTRHPAGTNAISDREGRLANLLMLSYEPMFAWSLDGPIEFWNVGAERLYGFAPNEAIGRNSHALLQTKFPIEFAGQVPLQPRTRGRLSTSYRRSIFPVAYQGRNTRLGSSTLIEVAAVISCKLFEGFRTVHDQAA